LNVATGRFWFSPVITSLQYGYLITRRSAYISYCYHNRNAFKVRQVSINFYIYSYAYPTNHKLLNTFVQSVIYLVIRSYIHDVMYSSNYPSTHLFNYEFLYLFTKLSIPKSMLLAIHSFYHCSINPFIYSYIYLSIHSPT
jgi:hypothetical protein